MADDKTMGCRKIVHMTSAHPVFDGRIFHKECVTLARAGFRVTLVAAGDADEEVEGVTIRTVKRPPTRWHRLLGTTWRVFLRSFREGADVYHFHDPELIPAGVLLKLAGKKVVFDVHEDVPKQILTKEWLGRSETARKVVAKSYSALEAFAILFFDAVVTVTPQIESRMPAEKTTLIRNFVKLALIDEVEPSSIKADKPVVVYNGTLHSSRGIAKIVEAVGELDGRVELWLIGKWPNDALRMECESLDGWRYTRYFGFLPIREVYALVKRANIGLHVVSDILNNEGGYPVKCFEYMACSLPFLVTDTPAKRDTFSECAVFVNPADAGQIANEIGRLVDSPEVANRLGQEGRRAVEELYNWELEGKRLVCLYERLLASDAGDP